jgi:hypothetical protein
MKYIDGVTYYNLGESVKLLKTFHDCFNNELTLGRIPEPDLIIGKRKFWSEDQLEEMKVYFAELKRIAADRAVWQSRIPKNVYTETKVARELGIPLITVRSWLVKGLLPEKTTVCPLGRILVWTQTEFNEIKKFVEKKTKPDCYTVKIDELKHQTERSSLTLHKYKNILNIGKKYGNAWWFTDQEAEILKNYVTLKSKRA